MALAFLAPLVARVLGGGAGGSHPQRPVLVTRGRRRARLALQLIPDAVMHWLVATAGFVLFLWFVPIYLGIPRHRPGRLFAGLRARRNARRLDQRTVGHLRLPG
jgi:hypothetical protein